MPFVINFVLSWTAFFLFADKRRWREFYPSVALAMIMSLASDSLVTQIPLWTYHDHQNWLSPLWVSLLDDFGIYPVVTYLFLQYYPKHRPISRQLLYFTVWTTGVILIEFLYLTQGWMVHRYFWSLPMSYFADWTIFFLLLRLHLRYHRPPLSLSETLPITTQKLSPRYEEYMRKWGVDLQVIYKKDKTEIFLVSMKPGGYIPQHFHSAAEHFFLLNGSMELHLGSESQIVDPFELVHLSENLVHGCRNLTQETILVISVFEEASVAEKLATVFEQHVLADPIPL